jgi:hypothetical protein
MWFTTPNKKYIRAFSYFTPTDNDKAEARSVIDDEPAAALTMTAGMKEADRSQAHNGEKTITLQMILTQLCDNCMPVTRQTYRQSRQAEQRNAIDDGTSTAASERLRDDSCSRNETCREKPIMELTLLKIRSQTMHTGGRHGCPARVHTDKMSKRHRERTDATATHLTSRCCATR